MKKTMALILVAAMAVMVGCAGHDPRPIESYQYGDESQTCQELSDEIAGFEPDIEQRYVDYHKKRQNKAAAWVFGVLIMPAALFALDTKSNPMVEVDAILKRRDALCKIAKKNGCEAEFESNYEMLALMGYTVLVFKKKASGDDMANSKSFKHGPGNGIQTPSMINPEG